MQESKNILAAFWKRKQWIIASTVAFTGLSIVYALFKADIWTGTQALIVRDESSGSMTALGRFDSVDSMQTAQETINEIAHHHVVLKAALEEVGPKKSILGFGRRKSWPSNRVVDDFGGMVEINAPHGAQFGRTELIYLTVNAESPERALALSDALTESLMARLRGLRSEKYRSIIAELTKASAIARTQLDKATIKLEAIDKKIGSDVVEIRVMNASGQGEGTLRRNLSEIRTELRAAKSQLARRRLERQQLNSLNGSPEKLIAMPNSLLDAQPTLQKLKEGLVDAQVTLAQVSGGKSPSHPEVRAAILAEQKVKQRLLNELQRAIRNTDGVVAAAQSQVDALENELAVFEGRFAGLTEIRSKYDRLNAEVEQKTNFIQKIEDELTQAKSALAAAEAVNLIQRVDAPIPSSQPIGPSGKTIVMAGAMAGFLFSLGLIWILEPVEGRRQWVQNRSGGRRASDRIAATMSTARNRRATDRNRRASDFIQSDRSRAVPNQEPSQPDSPETAKPGVDQQPKPGRPAPINLGFPTDPMQTPTN